MTRPQLSNDRFVPQEGRRIRIQVPQIQAQKIIDAVLNHDRLRYGDYDCVSYRSAPGIQHFRSLGSGRNAATPEVVEVPCVELSFFIAEDDAKTVAILKTIYSVHPYEEPVIFVEPCIRTLHIRGVDEDNPNRFWNNPPQDWVPEKHQ